MCSLQSSRKQERKIPWPLQLLTFSGQMRLVPSLDHLGHTSASLCFAESTFSNDKAPFVTFSLPHVIKFTPPSRQITSADDHLGTIQLETHPVLDAMEGVGEKEKGRKITLTVLLQTPSS